MIASRPDQTPRALEHAGPFYNRPAGFVSRFVALLIDVGVLGAVLIAGGAIWFGLLRVVSLGWLNLFANWLRVLLTLALQVVIPITGALGVLIGYFLLFFTVTGQTVGKRVVGLRVVSVRGEQVTTKQALLRLVGYVISALPLYLGFLAMLLDEERRTWHDRIAHTAVVYTWDARPSQRFLALAIQRARERTPGGAK